VSIRWTRLARADVSAIFDYIASENPAAAERLIEEIDRHVQRLAVHPGLGRPGRCAGTRELVISGTSYIAAYRVRGGEAQVLRVLHGARQWPDIP
jgi:addiction module RelE/StbE family toxin